MTCSNSTKDSKYTKAKQELEKEEKGQSSLTIGGV